MRETLEPELSNCEFSGRKKTKKNARPTGAVCGTVWGGGCGPNNYLPVDKCLTKFLSSQYFLESDSKL